MRDGKMQRARERHIIENDLQLCQTNMMVGFQQELAQHAACCQAEFRYCGIEEGTRGGERAHKWQCMRVGCEHPDLRQELLPRFKSSVTGRKRGLLPSALVNAAADAAVGVDQAVFFLESLGVGNLPLSKAHLYDLKAESNEVQIKLAYNHCEKGLENEKVLAQSQDDYGGDLEGGWQLSADVDGVYPTRTLGSNYARSSEVAVTAMGSLSKKPVALGFRSRACACCTHWERRGEEPPEHSFCTRNYNGTIAKGEMAASGDVADQVQLRGAVPTQVTSDGDTKNIAAMQARVSVPITGKLDRSHGLKTAKGRLLDDKKVHKLEGNVTENHINSMLKNCSYAIKDATKEKDPRIAVKRIAALVDHHLLLQKPDGQPDWAKAHSGCDPVWCEHRKEMDHRGVGADVVQSTPGGLSYPLISGAVYADLAKTFKREFSLTACTRLCTQSSTQNNESCHSSIARETQGKRKCTTRRNEYQAHAAGGTLEKADGETGSWRAERAKMVGLPLTTPQLLGIARRAAAKRQDRRRKKQPEAKHRRKELKRLKSANSKMAKKSGGNLQGGYAPGSVSNDGHDPVAPRRAAAPKGPRVPCPHCPMKFHARKNCPVLKKGVVPPRAATTSTLAVRLAARSAARKALAMSTASKV
jgi:hypothetical protein